MRWRTTSTGESRRPANRGGASLKTSAQRELSADAKLWLRNTARTIAHEPFAGGERGASPCRRGAEIYRGGCGRIFSEVAAGPVLVARFVRRACFETRLAKTCVPCAERPSGDDVFLINRATNDDLPAPSIPQKQSICHFRDCDHHGLELKGRRLSEAGGRRAFDGILTRKRKRSKTPALRE